MQNNKIPKRYVKIEKLKYRKYHIQDLNHIIKIVYPYRQTVNKYRDLLNKLRFTKNQQQLIIQTAHSLTIINEVYRDQDTYGRFYVTREDMINAIYMLQNELHLSKSEYLLAPNIRWFYSQLQIYFIGHEFTAKQVAYKLRKSKSTCYQHITHLVDRELIIITGKLHQSFLYQLVEKSIDTPMGE